MKNIDNFIKPLLKDVPKSLSNNFYLLKIVWGFSKSYFILYSVLTITDGLFPLIGLYFPKIVLDSIQKGKNFNTICYLVFAYFLITISYNTFSYILRGNFLQIKSDMLFNYFSLMIKKKVANLDLQYLEDPKIWDSLEKATKISQGGATKIVNAIFNSVSQAITIASIIIILSRLNFFIVLLAIIVVILNALLNNRSKRIEIKTYENLAPLRRKLSYYMNLFQDSKYAKELRLFNISSWIENKINIIFKKLEKENKSFYLNMHINYLISNIASLIQDIICYLLLGYQVIIKKITFGDFVLFFNAISRFTESLNGIAWNYIEVKSTGEYVQYFRDFLSIENKIQKEDKKMLSKKIEGINNFVIKFINVTFAYPGAERILFKNLNIEIESNKKYVIVGPNGAGKTTFVKLLTRLYDPQSGIIAYNGIDIKDINYTDYRKLFSVVFQDYQSYAASIKENVTLSEDNINDDAVLKILANVGLGEKIKTLEKGIYTQLYKIFDEKGIELSGGELQKLAIARAFFKDTPIIILDEPSSALDPYAEYELFRQFSKLTEGKTAVFISHRLSSVKFADYVIFIKEGEIVAFGTHEQLMEECNEYNEMYSLQAQYYR
ncbi:ABC transporter ATP-binding protein [Caldicellulosiruptoraceae bacterium PP1]